jgi:DNA polymerase elongation subunit (family B)
LNSVDKPFTILTKSKFKAKFSNSNLQSAILIDKLDDVTENKIKIALQKSKVVLVDGEFVKDWNLDKILNDYPLEVYYNWQRELDFIHGIDKVRFADYFKQCLDDLAASYGVDNKQDFELERVSESIINIAKKKYIQHIVYEDGIPYDRLTYIFPKGVELVRSSTPLFARDKIIGIVKYLFEHPDTFNIKELLKLVKNLRKEFDLCVPDRIDEISMQSSCSKYEEKVLNDKDKLEFVTGAHFAVKASAHFNYLLHRNKNLQYKYEFIKSGTKIKYYYCKDKSLNDIFAYIRGSFPVEMNPPEIDLDTQFEKCILSPINSIIEPLGLPLINKRLSVVMDIFSSGF